MLKLGFSSRLPLSFRDELEQLVFFNPQQHRFIDPLLAAVNRYGVPVIVEDNDRLSLRVPAFRAIQTLYALEEDVEGGGAATLAGVAAFVRESEDTLLLLHLAVHQDFTTDGPKADAWLAVRLMAALRDICRRTRGLAYLRVLYPKSACYSVRPLPSPPP